MKTKFVLIFLLITITVQGYSQHTDYYRWSKTYQKDGVMKIETANNGQFITRNKNVCYDSDKDGYSVGNGNLRLAHTTSDYVVYIGDCYYGPDCEYVFYDREGILNIEEPSGVTYVFVRETPPTNRNTCSLIKTNEETSVMPINTDHVHDNRDRDKKSKGTSTPREIICRACGGKGSIKQDVPSTSGYGVEARYTYCSICGKSSTNRHIHIKCKVCNGSGKKVVQ